MLKHYSTIKAKLTSNENGYTLITRNSHNDSLSYSKYRYKYSVVIPLCSILALLLVGMIGNACGYYDTYATNGNIDDSIKNSTSIENEEENSTSTITIDNSNSNDDIGGERGEGSVDSTNYTISRATSPSASLTINSGSSINNSTITTAGDVAYISNDIHVQASDIESYAVQISYASGSNSLSLADGSVVLSGANNTTPTNMSPNTWGYSWSSTNTNPESTTYQTLSTTNTQLSGDSVSNNSIDFTRRLIFAAKFGEGVKAGHYSTSVLLSLTATPKVVAGLDSITYMQEMTGEVCKQTPQKLKDQTIPAGGSKVLIDKRDNSTYTVARLEDGNCCMTQNLRLVGPITLTPTDSNVKSNYTLPGSNIDGFSSSSYYMSQVYYAGNTTHGAYYSFMAATAGTGNSSLINGDASGSICPKGWKLPSNYGNGSYNNFLDKTDIANSATGSARLRSDPYNFPYTGFVTNGRLFNIDSSGNHWSRTASSADHTNNLYFDNNRINPSANNGRYYGYPIRCVALGN